MPWKKLSQTIFLLLFSAISITPLVAKEMLFSPIMGGEHPIIYIDEEMNVGYIDLPSAIPAMISVPNSNKIYATAGLDAKSYVVVIDYSQEPKISNKILLPHDISSNSTMAAHPDGTKVYVNYGEHDYHEGLGRIGVIDTKQEKVTGLIDCKVSNLSFSPDGKTLYASGPETVYVIDTSSDSIKTQFSPKVSGTGPYTLAATPDDKQLYVVSDKDVIVLDSSSYETLFDVVNATHPLKPAFTSDSKWGFVPDNSEGAVSIVNNTYGSFWTQIKLKSPNQNGVVIQKAPDGIEYAYTYTKDNVTYPEGITAINTQSQKISAWLPKISLYSHPVFSKDGSKLYVATGTTVVVIDTNIHHFKIINQTAELGATPTCLVIVEID